MTHLPYLLAIWLFVIGLYGMVTSRNLVHLIACQGILQSSTYVLLLAIGYRAGAGPPIFSDPNQITPAVDPIVQALTLTDVVVGATVGALLLSLTVQIHKHKHTLDPRKLRPLRP